MRGLERDLAGRVRLVRLNVGDQVGAEARQQLGIDIVPALILYDGDGHQIDRTEGKLPSRERIQRALENVEPAA